MKKTAIIGIVVLLVMFFVTCDFFESDDGVKYTDVVYSEDGSRVTLYLDGVGVPVTAAQRAMSTRLSKMAYDYLDVIFLSGSTIARAQWELGQSAGISGVERSVDYKFTSGATNNVALLAVGRKEGKTLLGIGQIGEVDNSASLPTGLNTGPGGIGWTTGWVTSGGYPNVIYATVGPNSKSVTFYIEAVKTGLVVETPTAGADVATISSFTTGNAIWGDSTHTKLGNSYIPTYPLSDVSGATKPAKYEFLGAAKTYVKEIVGTKINVEPRFPRYLDNGGYRQLSAAIDMKSDVVAAPVTAFSNEVTLTFTTKGNGIFSFYIEMPVKILSAGNGSNAGKLDPITWKIRTGLGSELYSLDDGVSGGGCVLMTIGTLDLEDWLEIQWEWLTP